MIPIHNIKHVRWLCAQGISWAPVVINGCGNSRHMRRLRDIIAVVSRPNQHVVGQMSLVKFPPLISALVVPDVFPL